MLEYIFKTYSPPNIKQPKRVIDIDSTLITESQFLFEAAFSFDKSNEIKQIFLIDILSSIYLHNNIVTKFNGVTCLINRDFNNLHSHSIAQVLTSKMHLVLTSTMFFKELNKNKHLINNNVSIYFDSYDNVLNFSKDNGTLTRNITSNNIYLLSNFSQYKLERILNDYAYHAQGVSLIFNEKTGMNDLRNLVILYLKCAIICMEKTNNYLLSMTKIKYSKSKINNSSSIKFNGIKKWQNHIAFITMGDSYFYTQKSIDANIYLSINDKVFISTFKTYSNILSVKQKDTIIGFFDTETNGLEEINKIVLSQKVLDYFAFLKINRKSARFSDDYVKLNKVLNTIKSISVLKNAEIEFADIEKDISTVKIEINESNFEDILDGDEFNLIPKNMNEAILVQSMFDELQDGAIMFENIINKYIHPADSKDNPLFLEENSKKLNLISPTQDDIPF